MLRAWVDRGKRRIAVENPHADIRVYSTSTTCVGSRGSTSTDVRDRVRKRPTRGDVGGCGVRRGPPHCRSSYRRARHRRSTPDVSRLSTCGSVLRRIFRLERLSVRKRRSTYRLVRLSACGNVLRRTDLCGTSSDVYSDLGAVPQRVRKRLSTYLPTCAGRPLTNRLGRLSACGTSFDGPSWAPQRVQNVRRRTDLCGRRIFRLERCPSARAETSDDVSSGLSASARAETSDDVSSDLGASAHAERPTTYRLWAP